MTGRRDFFPLLSLLIFLSLYGCNNAANKVSDNDIDAPQTTASIPGGLYNTPQSVKLVCLDIGSGCSVSYYTTDNSEPDTNSTKYSGAISISSTANLRFFSMDKAGNREPAKSESYTIDQVAPSVKETISDPIIDVTASFSLVFDESMTPQSLTLGGDLADKANSSWSQKALANDTLTISAKNQWPLGTAQNLTIDATDLAGNSLPSQTLRFDIGVLHVSADDANAKDSNIGTQAQPFKTIVAAVNQAVATLSKSEIRVAQGNYTTFTQSAIVIDVPDGMRLLGGYSSDWASRNPVTTPSVVQDVSSDGGDFNNPNCVFTINAGAGSETLLDGFTIAGGSGTGAGAD